MKRIFLALALAAGLSACAGAGTLATAVSAATSTEPIGDKFTMDERGLYAMEALYNVPAAAYRSAVERKVMTPAIRARVRPILLEMRRYRDAARQAKKAGDAAGWNARIRELLRLKSQVEALLPSNGK
jgi:hypothetical protein